MIAPTVSARRADSLRQFWKNPQRIAAVKAKVLDAVRRDCPAKEIARYADISPTNACRWARVLGFRMMYVTDEERAQIMARRAGVEKTAA
jgi:FixJ family two-component response regulator